MLQPYVKRGLVTVLLRHRPLNADSGNDRVRAVTVRDLENGRVKTIRAPYFLDATEQGDLLPLTGTEYVTGFEARSQTAEPHAPEQAQPANV